MKQKQEIDCARIRNLLLVGDVLEMSEAFRFPYVGSLGKKLDIAPRKNGGYTGT